MKVARGLVDDFKLRALCVEGFIKVGGCVHRSRLRRKMSLKVPLSVILVMIFSINL